MKVIVATNNPGKLKEFREILSTGDFECLSMNEAGIALSPEETGTSFEENALIKARACHNALRTPSITLADDSGIMCDALNGAPGIYSARHGGPGLDDRQRLEYLLDEMKDVPDGQRGIQYYCALACVLPDGREFTVNGICRGVMLRSPRGTNGFGHDPVFYLPEYGKTFAELPSELKNRISHRAKALQACLEKLTGLEIYDADK